MRLPTARQLLAQRLAAVGALIASGALWCITGFSAGLDAGSENNAQPTGPELATTTVLTKNGTGCPTLAAGNKPSN